jgi:hypothetical protein
MCNAIQLLSDVEGEISLILFGAEGRGGSNGD